MNNMLTPKQWLIIIAVVILPIFTFIGLSVATMLIIDSHNVSTTVEILAWTFIVILDFVTVGLSIHYMQRIKNRYI